MTESRVQLFAIVVGTALLIGVVELVRQRRLLERYALVWLGTTALLLALAIWSQLLEKIASFMGIKYWPSALFVVALGFVILLLLHFSVVLSRLADRSRILAQRIALLEQQTGKTPQSEEKPVPSDGKQPATEKE